MHSGFLHSISDDDLLARLAALLCSSRRVEADLVAHIAEVDARQLYAREACSSMFRYCVERLHLSEPESALRIHAARATRRHPVLLDMLRDGRLHLSGIGLLAPHLTEANRDEVLSRATHRTRAQIEELVAEIAPRSDVRQSIRRLPARAVGGARSIRSAAAATESRALDVGGAEAEEARHTEQPRVAVEDLNADPSDRVSSGLLAVRMPMHEEVRSSTAGSETAAAAEPPAAQHRSNDAPHWAIDSNGSRAPIIASPPTGATSRPARPTQVLEPLSPGRYRVQFTASGILRAKLERLQNLMATSVPDGDLAVLIEAAVTEKIERLERERLGAVARPRKTAAESDTGPGPRHLPAAVKRAVRERDGDRCAFVDRQGHRCTETRFLQFHHRHPHGLGGDRSPENIARYCALHNAYEAQHDFGRLFDAPGP